VVAPDDLTWDSFVQQHPHGHLLQSSPWGSLKTRFGWARRCVGVAGARGLLAGAQVLFRHRLGLSVAYVPRGPLWSGDAEVDALLMLTLSRVARRARAVFLRLEPNMLEDDPAADERHSFLLLQGFQPAEPIQPRSSLHLDLAPPPERLLAAMSKGHRADIRRAEREGVSVRAGTSEADLDAFYAIMQATSTRAGFAIHSRAYYQTAWELLRAPAQHTAADQATPSARPVGGDAALLLAERDGGMLAAFLIFAWASAGLYLYSGSTDEGLRSGANHALQWHALRWAQERGCTLYDFWGIPDTFGQAAATSDATERARLEAEAQADPLHGVFRFKKGFGGQVVRYLPAYDQVYMPALYRFWQRRFGA
jgi:lipid II:glycine glycyltransferase (peptidoglycan interpeptide bridge formation enzyme)